MPTLDAYRKDTRREDIQDFWAAREEAEYVRAAIEEAISTITLLGGTRRTPRAENHWAAVLNDLEAVIERHVKE